MRYLERGLMTALFVGLLLAPQGAFAARPAPCEGLFGPNGECPADVGGTVAACCPCDDAKFSNHGRYVRCVAHATNALRRAGCLDKAARTSLKRCAARSTCGKPGAVTCCIERPGVCLEGFCVNTDPALACTSSEECPSIGTKCSIKRDEERCLAREGIPGTGSCCGACTAE